MKSIFLFSTIILINAAFAQTPQWEFLGLQDTLIFDIVIDDSGNIFIASQPIAVYKSTDEGYTWLPKNNGISASSGLSIDFDSQGNVYLAAYGGIFKSTNGGETWFRIAQELSDLQFDLVKIIPNDYIFVSNFDGIHRSTDYGQTWTTTDYTYFGAMEIGINSNGIMFAGNITASNFSIYRSTNLGENWIFSSSLPSNAFLFSNNGDVYAGVGKTDFNAGDIYKSTDDGLSWIRTFAFPDTFFITYNDFGLDRNGDFYLAISGSGTYSGVHISTDANISWFNYGFSLPTKCLSIDSTGYIYAGTNQQGIYRTAGRTVPVELLSFSANIDKNDVQLKWITETETNNYGFEIERKRSTQKWNKIGFVQGNGTTTETTSYSFTDKGLASGKYYYRLKQIDFDGTYEYSNTISIEVKSPTQFELNQNYPNPFNPSTTISYSIKNDGIVQLKIFDILGNEIAKLVNEQKQAGTFSVEFDASILPSGVYFYQLKTGGFIDIKKMMLLK